MMQNNIQDRLVAFVWTFLCVLTATPMYIFFRAHLKCCCFVTRWIQETPAGWWELRRTAWTRRACLMQCPSFPRTRDGGGRPAPRGEGQGSAAAFVSSCGGSWPVCSEGPSASPSWQFTKLMLPPKGPNTCSLLKATSSGGLWAPVFPRPWYITNAGNWVGIQFRLRDWFPKQCFYFINLTTYEHGKNVPAPAASVPTQLLPDQAGPGQTHAEPSARRPCPSTSSPLSPQGPARPLRLFDSHAAQLDVPGVGFVSQLPSSSLERAALTCSGCSFYRFVMLHLNPVTSDINLPPVHYLQQKINGMDASHLTGHAVAASLGVWVWTQS